MSPSDDQLVDKASDAPEVDPTFYAPQPYPCDEDLQPRYEQPDLEPSPKETPLYVVECGSQIDVQSEGLSKKRVFWITAICCTIILAIALVIGLTLGLRSQRMLPSSASPTSTSTSPELTTIPALENGVLEDTSLATVTTTAGSRHVFFQDFNQSLRHAVYDIHASKWLDGADYIYTKELPQNHTPIAAAMVDGIPNHIHLFYINTMGVLDAIVFVNGQSFGDYSNLVLMNDSFQAALGSRTLSVSQLACAQNGTAEALLLYEEPTGNVTVLHGYFPEAFDKPQWLWQNVSDAVHTSLAKYGTWLQAPVASNLVSLQPRSINICFLDPRPSPSTDAYTVSSITFGDWSGLLPNATQTEFWTTGTNSSELLGEDIISWSVSEEDDSVNVGSSWVEDDTLLLQHNPPFSYPFGRLASAKSADDSILYVYHQLTGSILAEDQYFAGVGWSTANIMIGTYP